MYVGELPEKAVGLKLYSYRSGKLVGCETVIFERGREAVAMTLNRASVSGRVEIGGEIGDHFADIYVDRNTWTDSVALDAGSYRALKTRWMRCKVEQ